MTYNEVLALTDSDLRIEVAKLTGATDFAYNPYDENRIQAYWPENDKGNGEGWREIPDYPNDIAAAWELVDRLRHPGNQWYATVSLVDNTTNYLCSVIFDYAEGSTYQINDKSAPRAITRAFILAMTTRHPGYFPDGDDAKACHLGRPVCDRLERRQ